MVSICTIRLWPHLRGNWIGFGGTPPPAPLQLLTKSIQIRLTIVYSPIHIFLFSKIYMFKQFQEKLESSTLLGHFGWKSLAFFPFSRAPIMSANPPFRLEFASRPTSWQHFFRIPLTAPQFGEKLNRQDFKGAQDLPKARVPALML